MIAQIHQELEDIEHQKSFPNLFLPAGLRDLNFSAAAAPENQPRLRASLDRSRAALEKALDRIFERLVVPLYLPGEAEPRMMRFFDVARRLAREIDPKARISPSGGVVRAAIGMLYEAMLRESEVEKSFDVLRFLEDIGAGKSSLFDARGNIMSFDVRGAGSDFDLLIDAEDAHLASINDRIKSLFGKVQDKELRDDTDTDDIRKALFTIADLRPRKEQIARSVRQGGASIDLLHFDLEKGALVEPEGVQGIVDELLLGRYRYLPPKSRLSREAPETTALRGPRALVELPFLRLQPSDQEQLNAELRGILKNTHLGKYPDRRAIDQLIKLRRNARLAQGNNRIARAAPNTTLGLIRSIADALEEERIRGTLKYPSKIQFNSYTPRYVLSPERAHKAARLPSEFKRALIPGKNFIGSYTDAGVLHHGTSGEGVLGSTRGGFRQTDYEFDLRRGTYSTPNQRVAAGYARRAEKHQKESEGYLLRLRVRNDQPVLALDAGKINLNSPAYKELRDTAKANGMELADWLAQEYGIDFIVPAKQPGVVIIKNAEALEKITLVGLVQDLVRSLQAGIHDPEANFSRLFAERKRLEDSKALFDASGVDIGSVPSIPELSEVALRNLSKMTNPQRIVDVYQDLSPEFRARIPKDGFGGRTLPAIASEAFLADGDFVGSLERGIHSKETWATISSSNEWPNLFKPLIAGMKSRAADPSRSAMERLKWLKNIALVYSNTRENRPEVPDLASFGEIPEELFRTLRLAMIKNPDSAYEMRSVEQLFKDVLGMTIDLTSEGVAHGLKRLRKKKPLAKVLEEFQLVSILSNGDTYRFPDRFPEMIQAMKETLPRVTAAEDFLENGLHYFLANLNYATLDAKPEIENFVVRALNAFIQKSHGIRDFDDYPGLMRLLIRVVDVVTHYPHCLENPKIVGELKRIHEKFDYEKITSLSLPEELKDAFAKKPRTPTENGDAQ